MKHREKLQWNIDMQVFFLYLVDDRVLYVKYRIVIQETIRKEVC